MNQIVNKNLLAGDKFMPEMHLRLQKSCKQEIQIISTKMN